MTECIFIYISIHPSSVEKGKIKLVVLEEVFLSRAIGEKLELDDSTGIVTHVKKNWNFDEYIFVRGWEIAHLKNVREASHEYVFL